VHYIQYIRDQTSKEVRNAETAVLTGNYQDAENILLQVNLYFDVAVMLLHLMPFYLQFILYITTVVNFTNILLAAFAPKFFHKKFQSQAVYEMCVNCR